MKRVWSYLLIGLGAFLLALAALLKFYAVPQLAKAPLSPGEDTGGITVTNSEGTAAALFDASALATGADPIRTNVPLTSVRNTRGDVSAAEAPEAKDQNLAIYDSFSRLTDSTGTVVNADTLRVAFDRVSSELVNCCGANYNGQDTQFEGINPLKFPMFTKQQDYQYFDTTLGKAWPAVYSGTEDLQGTEVYKFVMTIPPTQTTTMSVPGSLVGSTEATYEAPRFYANTRTLLVEPTTGAIVKGDETPKQTLRGPEGTDAVTLLQASIGYTPEQVTESLESANQSAGLLNTLNRTVPLVGLILGALSLLGGILLGRSKPEEVADFDSYDAEWDDQTAAVPAVAPAAVQPVDAPTANVPVVDTQYVVPAESEVVHETEQIETIDSDHSDLIPGLRDDAEVTVTDSTRSVDDIEAAAEDIMKQRPTDEGGTTRP